MNALLADLLQVLKLERLEIDLFRGQSRKLVGGRVFGGQVLGQALAAFAVAHHLNPAKKVPLQYTTTSPIMHKRLGVPD